MSMAIIISISTVFSSSSSSPHPPPQNTFLFSTLPHDAFRSHNHHNETKTKSAHGKVVESSSSRFSTACGFSEYTTVNCFILSDVGRVNERKEMQKSLLNGALIEWLGFLFTPQHGLRWAWHHQRVGNEPTTQKSLGADKVIKLWKIELVLKRLAINGFCTEWKD